jgi:hypothetical protein
VDDEHVFAFVEAIYGTDIDTVGVLALDALVVYSVGHGERLKAVKGSEAGA